MRLRGVILLATVGGNAALLAQAKPDTGTIAIVGATLIPMDRERTVPDRIVLVRDGRIVAVGPADSIGVPRGSTVIDGHGRYLMPGLADMHVHLSLGRQQRTFRDAPLYLANGVTTVLNLRGDSTQLAWRAQIAAGTLLGPTIYTSGRFVNEPLVNTPEEVEREVRAQKAAGFDVIKFREVVDTNLSPLTTHGLSREAYHRMMGTARELSIPVTGHAPNNLGLEAALEEHQSMAHVGYNLVASWFWPRETTRFKVHRLVGTWSAAVLALIGLGGWGAVAAGALRRRRDIARELIPIAIVTTLVLAAALFGARALWDRDHLGNPGRATTVTAMGFGLVIGAIVLLGWAVAAWRRTSFRFERSYSTIAALAAGALATTTVLFWVPVARRTTDGGLTVLARRMVQAGIWVTPTIQVYRSAEVAGNPEVRYVEVPSWWEPFRNPTPGRREWASGMVTFLERVVGILHREGVPLLAGTDALWAFVIPGFAIHDELGLMHAAGLTPYQVLRAATVEPARFLRVPDEFGTIALGRRADLVLSEKNPLEDLATLRKPLGVMARGRWFAAAELDAMLAGLDRSGSSVPTPRPPGR